MPKILVAQIVGFPLVLLQAKAVSVGFTFVQLVPSPKFLFPLVLLQAKAVRLMDLNIDPQHSGGFPLVILQAKAVRWKHL